MARAKPNPPELLDAVARRLWAAREPDNKFHGWEMAECGSLLETSFPFAREVPVSVRARLVRAAIFAAGRAGVELTGEILTREIRLCGRASLWSEPTFTYRERSDRLRATDWKRLREEQVVRTALGRCPYRAQLEEFLVRYARALDGRDMEAVFLRLWSLLESLTGTTAGESYDTTIDRASFLFGDLDVVRHLLEHLRSRRNRLVHQAEEHGAAAEELVYQVKYFVEALLVFHLNTGRQLRSMAKATEFLSLPRNVQGLEKSLTACKDRVRLLSRALKFYSPAR